MNCNLERLRDFLFKNNLERLRDFYFKFVKELLCITIRIELFIVQEFTILQYDWSRGVFKGQK